MGKGEIARQEQFLLFPQCFQKAFFPGASKGVIVWEWVKAYKLFEKSDADLSWLIFFKASLSSDKGLSISHGIMLTGSIFLF